MVDEASILDVIIVNWNSGDQLRACIESILENAESVVGRVVVVDNNSVDGSETFLRKKDRVTLLRLNKNFGFSRACNIGSRNSYSSYVLFINPDAVVYTNTLEGVLKFMLNGGAGRVGICGVQLIDEKGRVARSCTRFPTLLHFFCHVVGVDHFLPQSSYVMKEWPHDNTREVDHVIGAFYLVRRELFEKLGGFDERFFVYLEDLDFSYRAHQAGWKTVYLADVQAFHAGGGTSSQVKAMRLFYSLRSRLLYGFKHFPAWQAWMLVLLTCLIEPVTRTVYCLLKRDWIGVKNTFRGYQMLFTGLPAVFKNKSVSGE